MIGPEAFQGERRQNTTNNLPLCPKTYVERLGILYSAQVTPAFSDRWVLSFPRSVSSPLGSLERGPNIEQAESLSSRSLLPRPFACARVRARLPHFPPFFSIGITWLAQRSLLIQTERPHMKLPAHYHSDWECKEREISENLNQGTQTVHPRKKCLLK